ncbi:MAG: hypothetical protein JWP99_1314 [Devosia sp.]|nr:hypothetical protein [Devosia sp.]
MPIDLNQRRPIGDTRLELPALGFGAAHLGGMHEQVPGETAYATLKAAWDGGIRYYDTAPFYGRGLSEHRTGDFLLDRPRDQFVITTKVGRYFRRPDDVSTFDRSPWKGGLGMEIVWDYSYDGVMRSYEQSLLRLGLDTVDALLIHDPEASIHTDEHECRMRDMSTSGIKALQELKRSGQIKAIGMGMNAAESLTTIAPLVPLDFCIVAMPYTLLEQEAAAVGMQRCVDENIAVVIGAPFASGILVTGPGPGARYRYGPASKEIQDKVAKIQSVCTRHGVSLPAAALQFPLAHPAVVSIIPGGARPEEVTSNLVYAREQIPPALWADLKTEGLITSDAPVPA